MKKVSKGYKRFSRRKGYQKQIFLSVSIPEAGLRVDTLWIVFQK
ncbi:MAG: hypothetical protein PHU91_01260 [Candidatus Omnitrophica bacterium]|nr:hypothetical protein [Candidatus Omnitrophota bacterium]